MLLESYESNGHRSLVRSCTTSLCTSQLVRAGSEAFISGLLEPAANGEGI